MTNSQSHTDGTLSDDELHWLALRTESGFGMITTCAAHVSKHGQGWPGELGIFDDRHVPGLARLAEDIRWRGGLPVVQICHGGLRADRSVSGDGMDFLHLSLWDAFKNTRKRPAEHALQAFRAAIPGNIPLFAAGQIWTRDDAERVLDLGADVIALGRAAIVNPDWPLRISAPGWQPQQPPVTAAQLRERGLNPVFIERLRRREGFVAA